MPHCPSVNVYSEKLQPWVRSQPAPPPRPEESTDAVAPGHRVTLPCRLCSSLVFLLVTTSSQPLCRASNFQVFPPHPHLIFCQIILLPVPARPVDKHSLNHPSCRLSCHEGRVTPFLRPTQSFAISSGSHQLPVLWLQPLPWNVSHQHSIAWYSLF